MKTYHQQKTELLDSLLPDDFRNGKSFNQAEKIIDELGEAFYQNVLKKKNSEEFLRKAVSNLFRENSPAIEKTIALLRAYLEMKK